MADDSTREKIESFYDEYYKAILLIPLVMFLLAAGSIGYKYVQDGEFINKGISFSGGTSITLENVDNDAEQLRDQLRQDFPSYDIDYRLLGTAGQNRDIIIETNIDPQDDQAEALEQNIRDLTGVTDDNISVERIGAAFGESFFQQMIIAVVVAFVFMAAVIFFYFRTVVPSLAVIMAALFNIVIALAIVNIVGIQMGTAGVAGLLMLIGYSIDTDILLKTRILREKRGNVNDRIYDAFNTGITMTLSSFIALLIAYIVVSSEVLREIALVVMIGLLADIISTYFQNASLLKWYLERTGKAD